MKLPLYFAYGSNLNPTQMAARCPGHVVVGRASLPGFVLRFRGHGRDWAGAVGTIEPLAGSTVHGVLFQLTSEHYSSLDGYEGYDGPEAESNLYDRVEIQVVGQDGVTVEALTYVIRPLAEGLPSRAYRDAIVAGLKHHGSPADYIARVEGMEVTSPEKPQP